MVKVVNVHDMQKVHFLREQSKPVKHVSWDPQGRYLACSCTDGVIYIYSMTSEEPSLFRKIDGIIPRLENDGLASSKAVWHPDGRTFAAPTATRDIQIVSIEDGEKQRSFTSGHGAEISCMAWSPNGALLMSASVEDDRLTLWETKTQKVLKRFSYERVINMTWHPLSENTLLWTNTFGEVAMATDFLQDESDVKLLKGPKELSPFFHDPLKEGYNNARLPIVNGHAKPTRPARLGSPDSVDDDLDIGMDGDEDGWIEDDDGAGYTNGINGHGKRTNGHLDPVDGSSNKRSRLASWQPQLHDPFQPGSTPWRGNRKYLCLNLTGFVWTVDQDTHNTVTVEFYDRETHRDFHFTDPFLYDKACLNEKGTLFSCPATKDSRSMIFYRPHETWTNRSDWRTSLPHGEEVTAISLSSSYVLVTTTANYVRIYTQFGTPLRIHRLKRAPIVTCASHGEYIMTISNGPVNASSGSAELVYTIENVARDTVCQGEDIVALPEGATLRNAFFSDTGDPYIYDSTQTLLTCLHWRTPGAAKWVPLLDTRQLDRLRDGKKEESYWPVAVAEGKFHCIILKGGDRYPYFPRPLLSEFEFKVPVSGVSAGNSKDAAAEGGEESNASVGAKLEETYVRTSVLMAMLEDSVAASSGSGSRSASSASRSELVRMELEADKTLLQLLAVECREGEERGMRALEVVRLMRDRGGKMLEAAGKVAARYGRGILGEKIREVQERRLVGLEDGDGEEY